METLGWLIVAAPILFWVGVAVLIIWALSSPFEEDSEEIQLIIDFNTEKTPLDAGEGAKQLSTSKRTASLIVDNQQVEIKIKKIPRKRHII